MRVAWSVLGLGLCGFLPTEADAAVGYATHLAIKSGPIPASVCMPITVQTETVYGYGKQVPVDVTVSLTAPADLKMYADSSCKTATASVKILANQWQSTVYVRTTTAGVFRMTASNPNLISANTDVYSTWATHVVLKSSASVNSATCTQASLSPETVYGYWKYLPVPLTVTLSGASYFKDANCTETTTSASIPANTGKVKVYFKTTKSTTLTPTATGFISVPATVALNGTTGTGGGTQPLATALFSAPPFPPCEHGSNRIGRLLEVGDNLTYPNVNDVPWETLGAGDTVRIHGRPTPYAEKILISTRGSAEQPIVVCGVAGQNGERPVLTGVNARNRLGAPYPSWKPFQGFGLITVVDKNRWGNTPATKIGNIVIQGLTLTKALPSQPFYDNTGALDTWSTSATGLYIYGAENVVVRGNVLTDNGNGLFVTSKGNEHEISRDILVQGNQIYGNGSVTSYLVHNIYTEASGIVFENNYLGQTRPGAKGANLKDRSAGLVIRNNWIESAARTLDLVDPQESYGVMINEPDMHETHVYGNVFVNTPPNVSGSMIHYGGDSFDDCTDLAACWSYRNGTLHFYNNTVYIRMDQLQSYRINLFHLSSNFETVVLTNNIIHRTSSTPGATPTTLQLMTTNQGKVPLGNIVFRTNWMQQGYVYSNAPIGGTVQGEENLILGTDPGFTDKAQWDFSLSPTSPALGRGEELFPTLGYYDLDWQLVPFVTGEVEERTDLAVDLGAFGADLPILGK